MKCIVIGKSVDGRPLHQIIVSNSEAALEIARRWLDDFPALVRVEIMALGSREILYSLTPGAL